MQAASSADGSLVTSDAPTSSSGTDALGDYTAQSFDWAATKGGKTLMTTSFRSYAADEGMIVFEQLFPADLETGTPKASTSNPRSAIVYCFSFSLSSTPICI